MKSRIDCDKVRHSFVHNFLNDQPVIEVARLSRRHRGTPIRWCRELPQESSAPPSDL